MSRRLSTGIERRALELELAMRRNKPKRKFRMSAGQVARFGAEVRVMMASKEWVGASPGHAVALWAILHAHVYGVEPVEELRPASFARLCFRAADLSRRSFGGDVERLVSFVTWTWVREREKHELGGGSRRLGGALQFSGALVTDWRMKTGGRGAR